MVIISTMAIEVSIQAVSPEFGVQFSVTLTPSQAGGPASAAGAAGAAAGAGAVGAGAFAEDAWDVGAVRASPSSIEPASAKSFARENMFNDIGSLLSVEFFCGGDFLQRGGVGLAGADAHRVIEPEDEDLAVADLAGLRRRRDGVDDLVDLIGGAGDFQLDLRQEAHGVFGAAIDFGVALLAPVALHLGDGQSLNADLGQRVADLVELERLDDGHDDFHVHDPLSPDRAATNGRVRQSLKPPRNCPLAALPGGRQSSAVPTLRLTLTI